jgi:ribosome biogenesis GTPase
LTGTFPDVAALGGNCRFRDCRHDREPGCTVKEAVESGQLDRGRYESFLKLQAEQQEIERRRQERELQAGKRKSRG